MAEIIRISDEAATIVKTKKAYCKTMPNHILSIIEARKTLINDIRKFDSKSEFFTELKKHYNLLTKTIKSEMVALKVQQWTAFCESVNDKPKFSGNYWKMIKKISSQSNEKPKYKSIPKLFYANETAVTDESKANVFARVLKATFAEDHNNSFDNDYFKYVNDYVNDNESELFSTTPDLIHYDDEFQLADVKTEVTKLRPGSAPGNDQIRNTHIMNLPEEGLKLLVIMTGSWS